MADWGAGGAGPLPRRCLGALAPTALGGTIRPPRATGKLLDVGAPHAAAALAEARHRVPPIHSRGGMVRGRLDAGACDVAPPRIVVGDARASHCEALLHRGSGKALGDPSAGGCIGALCAA